MAGDGKPNHAFNQWATELGKPVLSFDQAALIEAMAGGVADHLFARSLLTSGQAEGVVRLPYAGHACQGRFDWFSFESGLVDLKTCDDLTWFESDALQHAGVYADDSQIDSLSIKECPECQALIASAFQRCPQCGYEFPPPERQKHEAKASTAGVRSVFYAVHTKRGADENVPKTLRVEYEIGWNQWQKEWVCVEHQRFARRKAEAWWAEHSDEPCPTSAEVAVKIATRDGLAEPSQITVRNTAGEEFDRIVGYELSALPAMREPGADENEPVPVLAWDDFDDEPPF